MVTKEPVKAAYERSDWCVVPAGAVAGEAMVALVLADAFLQKFGGDSLAEMQRNFDNYADKSTSSEAPRRRRSRPRKCPLLRAKFIPSSNMATPSWRSRERR